MKKFSNYCGIFATLFVTTTIILLASCSQDDDYYDSDMYKSHKLDINIGTRGFSNKYLEISTYDSEKWTKEDYKIMALAEERMGVTFIKNRYIIKASCGEDVNISDSLFNLVKSRFEYSNSIINANSSKRLVRMKKGDPESSSIVPDCVPAAVAHMGQGAPSYDAVVAKCDLYDPNWRNNGGVASSHVGPIIRCFTNATTLAALPSDTNFIPNKCVMLIPKTGKRDHAVNVTNVTFHSGGATISYEDHSSSSNGSGSIQSNQMTSIYPFKGSYHED